MSRAYLNAIGTAVTDQEVHGQFIGWARAQIEEPRLAKLFDRMVSRSGIERRWSVLGWMPAGAHPISPAGFYGSPTMPGTAERMTVYAQAAPALSMHAIDSLKEQVEIDGITHLVVASCTGFVAPGIDQIIAARLGLAPSVERLVIGFMGCYAGVSALRTARHLVRSDPDARVLVINVELCTLHLQRTGEVDRLLAMLQFGDGAAAALVTADPQGFELEKPFNTTLPSSDGLIRWTVTDQGFVMHLSGEVPKRIAAGLADEDFARAATGGRLPDEVDGWAVHAGGRSILDAVENAFALPDDALAASRDVLIDNGNMSSATILFTLGQMLAEKKVDHGVALAFGPGLAAEGFGFRSAA